MSEDRLARTAEHDRLTLTEQRLIRMRLWSMLSDLAGDLDDAEREAEAKTLSVALAANLGPVIERIISARADQVVAALPSRTEWRVLCEHGASGVATAEETARTLLTSSPCGDTHLQCRRVVSEIREEWVDA